MIGADSHTPNARRPRHAGHRRGRRRLRRGDGRAAVGGAASQAGRRAPHRQALGLDGAQGRHHLSLHAADREGRHQQDHRVLRARRGVDQRHRQGRRSATWAPSWAPRPRSSRSTRAWPPTCAPPSAPTSPRWPRSSASTWWPTREVAASPKTFYDEIVEINLDTLEPHVVGPHSPDRGRPISQAGRRGDARTTGRRPSPTRSSAPARTPPTRTCGAPRTSRCRGSRPGSRPRRSS